MLVGNWCHATKGALSGLRKFLVKESPLTLKELGMGDQFEFELPACGSSENVSFRERG